MYNDHILLSAPSISGADWHDKSIKTDINRILKIFIAADLLISILLLNQGFQVEKLSEYRV